MDFSHYPEEIQTLSSQILETRYTDRKLVMEYCSKLISIGHERKDSYLLGFSYYYLAEGYFVNNDYNNFVKALTISIEYQQQSSQWMLLTRAYNMLGVNEYTQGNIAVALDHYLMALRYCEDYHFEYEKAMVYTNIGHIYLNQKNYTHALSYLSMGRELFEKEKQVPFAKTNIVLIDISMGRAYLALKDLEKAMEREALIVQNEKGLIKDDESELPIMCFKARIAYARGCYEESQRYIRKLMGALDDCTSILDIHDDILGFVMFLLDIGYLQEFIIVAEKVNRIIDQMCITKIKMDMLRLWIKYYQKLQDEEKYLRACARLYELEEVNAEENINILRNSTQLRFKLEESKRIEEKIMWEKQALIEKSETDALTGLPNRYRLNDYTEQIFEKALREGKNLGIEMLDIDYFKEYNDTYGHQAGDEMIRALAECLRKISEQKDFFSARYGGDEFMLVYYDKTDEMLLEIAAEIRNNLQKLKIHHIGSKVSEYVTVSQGICNAIPRNGNKIWDYQFGADTALYKMKKRGRNGIYLVHEMEADSADSIVIKE